jgi:hypothetical protein
MNTRRLSGWAAASLVVLALAAFAGEAPTEFVYDDRDGIAENPSINGELPISSVFTRDFWGRDRRNTVGTYRPTAVAVSRLTWTLGGGTPQAFRTTSLLLHLAVVLTGFFVLSRLVPVRTAWLGMAFFAVCAASSEALLCHVGNADVLCTLAALIGLSLHRKPGAASALGAAVAFVFALGAKESGLVAPAAWLAFDLLLPSAVPWPARLRRLAGYGLASVPYFIGRVHALGGLLVPSTNEPLHNPLVSLGFFARELGAARVFLSPYVTGLLVPWRRLYDCSRDACGPASPSDPVAWAGLLLWLALLAAPFLLRRRAPAAAAGLAWFVLFFLPGSNFVVKGPTIYGERLLYLPGMGLFLAVAVGLAALARTSVGKIAAGAVIAAFLGLNLVADRNRLHDWQSREALALSGLRYAAESAVVQINVAVAARPHKDYAAMEQYARRATEIDPTAMAAHRELAAALYTTGRMEEARKEFETAYALSQDEILIFDYANFLGRQQEYEKGLTILDRYLAKNPNHPELAKLRERMLQAKKRSEEQKRP